MTQDYYFKPDPPLDENTLVGWAIVGMQELDVEYIKVELIDGIPTLLFQGAQDIHQIRNWLIKEGLKTNEQQLQH